MCLPLATLCHWWSARKWVNPYPKSIWTPVHQSSSHLYSLPCLDSCSLATCSRYCLPGTHVRISHIEALLCAGLMLPAKLHRWPLRSKQCRTEKQLATVYLYHFWSRKTYRSWVMKVIMAHASRHPRKFLKSTDDMYTNDKSLSLYIGRHVMICLSIYSRNSMASLYSEPASRRRSTFAVAG